MHLASGLSVGLSGIAAGYTIGIVGDAVRSLHPLHELCTSLRTPGCPGVYATVSSLCWYDPDPDLR